MPSKQKLQLKSSKTRLLLSRSEVLIEFKSGVFICNSCAISGWKLNFSPSWGGCKNRCRLDDIWMISGWFLDYFWMISEWFLDVLSGCVTKLSASPTVILRPHRIGPPCLEALEYRQFHMVRKWSLTDD